MLAYLQDAGIFFFLLIISSMKVFCLLFLFCQVYPQGEINSLSVFATKYASIPQSDLIFVPAFTMSSTEIIFGLRSREDLLSGAVGEGC
jgi:hypothetical protein